MSAINYSGQARIAHDTALRKRRIADVLRYDLLHGGYSLEMNDITRDRIARMEAEAEEIEVEVRQYIGEAAAS